MTTIGKAVRVTPEDDITIRLNSGQHFRVRASDARRLASGKERTTEIYHLSAPGQVGKLEMVKTDFYRLVSGNLVTYCHANRLNLLFRGLYYWAPISDWCREAGL